MTVRLDTSLLRRVPLDGQFTLQFLPYAPHVGILYREDADSGVFVEIVEDEKKPWRLPMTGEKLQRVLDFPRLCLDSQGLLCDGMRVWDEAPMLQRETRLRSLAEVLNAGAGSWYREGDVLVFAHQRRVVFALRLSEAEWNSVLATFPPPTSPSRNSSKG